MQGTGYANPIRENPRSPNIEVNKSVVLQISSTLEVKTPSQSPASSSSASGTGSTDWDLTISSYISILGHIFILEIKNLRTGQIRAVVLVGGGIPSMEYIESDSFRTELQRNALDHNPLTGYSFPRVTFRCTREIDFSDFDGTRVLLQGDPQLDYLIGPSDVQISFPDLEPQVAHWIDFGEIPFPTTVNVGVKCIDWVGVCKEIGETWLS